MLMQLTQCQYESKSHALEIHKRCDSYMASVFYQWRTMLRMYRRLSLSEIVFTWPEKTEKNQTQISMMRIGFVYAIAIPTFVHGPL